MLTNGELQDFHEWEVRSETTMFNNIASRQSHYCKQGLMSGAPYDGQGRKFIQLRRQDGRWLISAVLWEDL